MSGTRWTPAQYNEWLIKQSGSKNPRTPPVVEPDPRAGALAAVAPQESNPGKFLIRVTSRRLRLIDEDNLCEKFHVDCCRYSGLIPSDAPERAHIEVRQEKISKGETEETIIEIEQIL